MAAALIGEAFLSASIQVLCDRITSTEFIDFFQRKKLDESLLMKLKITLLALYAVLSDAEEKQIVNPAVRNWLDELKHAVFDAEDLLDEIDTEALRCKVEGEGQNNKLTSKVWNCFFTSRNSSYLNMNGRIEELFQRLKQLAKEKDVIGLREVHGVKVSHRTPTTSLVDDSRVYGRDDDKKYLSTVLLSDDASDNDVCVLAIVGMGGVGKTALAQILYNDDNVKEHFALRAWACVSEDYDPIRVTKTLLESVTSKPCNLTDLNLLQLELKKQIRGKKFLFVLDDLWNEKYVDWDHFQIPFTSGARGSKVMVTTRSTNVASIMRNVPIHELKPLSNEDCWFLLAQHAFGNQTHGSRPKLEEIGKKIAVKCNGLPLAAKTIGGLLRCKIDAEEWNSVLNSNIWELPYERSNILPALWLSYHYLPAQLKQCFVYCSIFPKGYRFKREEVVLLWVAEGLIVQVENMKVEEVAEKYFDELLSRSLFQKSRKMSFKMHDLINGLATFMARGFCYSLEGNESHEVPKIVRHFSYVKEEFDAASRFGPLYGMKCLRTFLPLALRLEMKFYVSNRILQDLLPTLTRLRVLSLSKYKNITEVPDSIGHLIHLRYMDVSYTSIERLPDIVCTLYNLQTLLLSNCSSLTKLPAGIPKLINLHHLNFKGTNIGEMPSEMGRLKGLRTLTTFIVGKSTGSSIKQLRELSHLRGKLSILKLRNVLDLEDAVRANLKNKKDLKELELAWGDEDTNDSEKERHVLDKLQPSVNLEKLAISFYGGISFPNWLGNSNSLSNIQFMRLSDCSHCLSLPSFGQLPTLKVLYIERMKSVMTVGIEFYGGNGTSVIKPFQSLEKLAFKKMPEWEEWQPSSSGGQQPDFPRLQELILDNCPKLRGLPYHLPCLKKLSASECGVLQGGTATFTIDCLKQLRINECPGVLTLLDTKSLSLLQYLNIQNVVGVKCLPKKMVHSRNFLHHLGLYNCPSLESFPKDSLPTTLTTLIVANCKRLEFLPHEMMSQLTSLDYLRIENSCDSLKSFPLGILPNLSHLVIHTCENLESLSIEGVDENLSHLNKLQIRNCQNFLSFPRSGLPTPNLTDLRVLQCKNLESMPKKIHTLIALRQLELSDLPKLVSFAREGLPPNLQEFEVNNCDELRHVDVVNDWGLQGLVSLQQFHIGGRGSDAILETLLKEKLLPTALHSLHIFGLSSLKVVNGRGLQHLTSLRRLKINQSPSLEFLPEEGFPASLSCLSIHRCSSLSKRCQNKTGEDWAKISHIPLIKIDDEVHII
ncbi:hypothetical protein C1H46_030466 [Malus baccata]|uniref:NB-ARC domain-containing protein n=1 Tax=Malus baccata TaxID=106549 RepID=A0A540LC13_MALBA|nr:hypothetical protein C1H46_030466 [Malus baccata]